MTGQVQVSGRMGDRAKSESVLANEKLAFCFIPKVAINAHGL